MNKHRKLSLSVFCNPSFQECYRGGRKLDRKQLLHYLIYMLLPVLKKVNHDQSIELETESKVTGMRYLSSSCNNLVSLFDGNVCGLNFLLAIGKEQSEIQIPQAKLGFHTSYCWYVP